MSSKSSHSVNWENLQSVPTPDKPPTTPHDTSNQPELTPDPKENATKGGRAALTIRSIDEILRTPDSPADLILSNGYVERGERTAICGMGGIGKSRLVMQLAMMHRAGKPFLAWETSSPHLKWLFLQTENGSRRLKRDLEAMLRGFTASEQEAIKSGIFIHTLEGEDDGNLLLDDLGNHARIIDAIQASGADIVIWDPLRDCTGEDLNKDTAMGETLRTIRHLTRAGNPFRTCIVIHHAGEGKAGVAKAIGYDRGAFGRNSKVLKTWARAQFNIAPASPDDNSQIIIASGKCNNFEEFSPIAARLDSDTLLYELVEDFDFQAWKESVEGTSRPDTSTTLAELLNAAGGGLEKNEAIQRLQSKGIGKHTAREIIAKAVSTGQVEETPHVRSGKRAGVYLTLK